MHAISYAPTGRGEFAVLALCEEATAAVVPGPVGGSPRVLNVEQAEMDAGR